MATTSSKAIESSKKQYWQKLMRSYKSSGLTQKIFCKQNDLNLATFTYWRSRLSLSKKAKSPQTMMPIKITGSTQKLRASVQLLRIKLPNGMLIEFPSTLGEAQMRVLFCALGIQQ